VLVVLGFVVGLALVVICDLVRNCENAPCARFPGWIGPVVGIGIVAAGVLVIRNGPSNESDRRQ
jgi:hypothetical protein